MLRKSTCRLTAILITLCLALTLAPITASAAEGDDYKINDAAAQAWASSGGVGVITLHDDDVLTILDGAVVDAGDSIFYPRENLGGRLWIGTIAAMAGKELNKAARPMKNEIQTLLSIFQ